MNTFGANKPSMWLTLAAVAWLPAFTFATEPPQAIRVYPAEVALATVRDGQSLVVQAEYANGMTRDVTDQVTWKLDRDDVVTQTANRLLPKADGAAKLTASFETLTAEVPIQVAKAAVDPPISFKLDVMPVFLRAGCNTGSCHGSARGRDSFRLSLFGFDPEGDYFRITREQPERRIDLSIPSECLIIEKAAGQVPHTGGSPVKKGDEYYQTLLRWLESGAPADSGEVPTVTSVELYPPTALLNGTGETQQMTVRAKYSDGSDRDVTNLAVFLSSNDNAAPIST